MPRSTARADLDALRFARAATLALLEVSFRAPNELRGAAETLCMETITVTRAPWRTFTADRDRQFSGHEALRTAVDAVAVPCVTLAALRFGRRRGAESAVPMRSLQQCPAVG